MAKYKTPEKVETYWIETYGCEMNIAESNAIKTMLEGVGITPAKDDESADLAILNTCSVRQSAENRVWGRIGNYSRIKKERPMILMIIGCMAERLAEELKDSAPWVDYVLGTNDKHKVLDIATGQHNLVKDDTYSFLENYYKEGDYSTFVPIMNGCNNFCTYCIVPYVRGREVSRSLESIINEVKFLDSKKVKEITLLGQNVNSYHYEDENNNVYDFPKLLRAVSKVCNNIEWVRFESPHPKDFSDELLQVVKEEKKVANHLHIPLQSGNSRILKLMNRRYDREKYLSIIEKAREIIPEITFATDVMVGFPSESEEECLDTLSVMEILRCNEAYMYFWNPREGTPATKMDGQLSDKVKHERLQKIIDRQQEIFHEEKAKYAHGIHKVLVTKTSRNDSSQMLGKDEHNQMVAFNIKNAITPGEIVNVEYLSVNGNTIVGKQV
ncbi:MAG: tRNA (N6-isopentenyl adenosine(37)-C2)-methylthiotransferase MiaB [Pleomorphochaeta sp.]